MNKIASPKVNCTKLLKRQIENVVLKLDKILDLRTLLIFVVAQLQFDSDEEFKLFIYTSYNYLRKIMVTIANKWIQ